jgi:hypothetical protein
LSEPYYVCVYLEDGEPIAHVGSQTKEFPQKFSKNDDENSKVRRSSLKEVSEQFVSAAMGYLDYVPLILSFAPLISRGMVQDAHLKYLEANCVSCERTETRAIYEFGSESFVDLRRFQENLSAAQSTIRSLPRLLTVDLVTSLEYHLNLIMKEIAAFSRTGLRCI